MEVVSLSDDVFYGNLILEVNGQEQQVDCRPSDALALATRTQSPIFISEDVMRVAGIVPELDISDEEPEGDSKELSDEEAQDLDIFEDFLQNFDIDDLDEDEDAGKEPD